MHPEPHSSADESAESLAARLRALPQPVASASLEARLLAAIPPTLPITRRRPSVWTGVTIGVAAACALTALCWSAGGGKRSHPGASPTEMARPIAAHLHGAPKNTVGEDVAVRSLGETSLAFRWPLEETSPLTVSSSFRLDAAD